MRANEQGRLSQKVTLPIITHTMKHFIALLACACVFRAGAQQFITTDKSKSGFTIAGQSAVTTILSDEKDEWLAGKAVALLRSDLLAVTGTQPALAATHEAAGKNAIIAGTMQSRFIAELVRNKKIDLSDIRGKWEAYHIEIVSHPYPNIDKALVIAGSDKRGAAFGIFELARQIGVSPWYWWADVPVQKHPALYVVAGTRIHDQPSVKYRGIFINDEAPAFSGWTKEKFGGVNHLVYEKIFELLLRLKANYLWPAMWGNAFNDDDTLNPVLADRYGIVMGTSHHEPMMRAQQEWKRYGKGEWNYEKNDSALRKFWRKGIQNMGTHESVVSIGMRGDGDIPMTQGSNTALLERIVADQRRILEEVTGKPASDIPQSWALYKEVQDYYDKGMRVPDDVTLLLCDDNWGSIRKLPRLSDPPRKGGYGIYYHFDYVGGPRNYKWINTNPIARTWEQMHLAYEYGVKNIWVVNVGDLKPMEFPISFFLDYAWAPERIGAADLAAYTRTWSAAQFGGKEAAGIAEIISKYSKYNGRRKPELLDANTYSLQNYDELKRVTDDYNNLLAKAEAIGKRLDPSFHDAYFELVLHPVKASANLQNMYAAVARNRYYASNGSPEANAQADLAKKYYIQDSLISVEYNQLANGKWNHMMDQTHIGYTYWQQPPVNKMPVVTYVPAASAVAALPLANGDRKIFSALQEVPANTRRPAFYEYDGYLSIDADHYSAAVNTGKIKWLVLPDHGKTGNAITTMPVTAAEQTPGGAAPHLEYVVYTGHKDTVQLACYFSPTLNFHGQDGLKYAISVDDESPQVVTINKDDNNTRVWEKWVANNIIVKTTTHHLKNAGRHVIRYWMISPAVVLQRITGNFGGLKPSYLGPPETIYTPTKN